MSENVMHAVVCGDVSGLAARIDSGRQPLDEVVGLAGEAVNAAYTGGGVPANRAGPPKQ